MGIADLTRFCNICFVCLVIEICCFLICKSNGSCGLNFYKENGTCIACPRGSFGYDCNMTCPSEYFGQKCNEKCNCSSNQHCDPVIGCPEKNVTTERLSIQHLTETPNFTVSTNFSKNRDDTATTKDLSRLKINLFVFIGSFCVGVTVAFLMILKSRLEIAGIYPVRCKIADRQRECSFEQDNIEADDDGLVLNGHSNTRRETVDSSNNVYYELGSTGLNDDNTDSLTEHIYEVL